MKSNTIAQLLVVPWSSNRATRRFRRLGRQAMSIDRSVWGGEVERSDFAEKMPTLLGLEIGRSNATNRAPDLEPLLSVCMLVLWLLTIYTVKEQRVTGLLQDATRCQLRTGMFLDVQDLGNRHHLQMKAMPSCQPCVSNVSMSMPCSHSSRSFDPTRCSQKLKRLTFWTVEPPSSDGHQQPYQLAYQYGAQKFLAPGRSPWQPP